MAVDMVAQREQRAHQRRVEASLGRQEERYYVERIHVRSGASRAREERLAAIAG